MNVWHVNVILLERNILKLLHVPFLLCVSGFYFYRRKENKMNSTRGNRNTIM